MGKEVITAADVAAAAEAGSKVIEAPSDEFIVTPGARDMAISMGINLIESESGNSSSASCSLESARTDDIVDQVTKLIKDRLPADFPTDNLESLVRKVAEAEMGRPAAPSRHNPDQTVKQLGGVCFVKGNMIPGELSGPIPVEEKVRVADAFRCSENATLAGGYMEWSKASFDRTVDNNEINIVIEGELHLSVDGQTSVVEQGDMVYLPGGTEVTYGAPGKVKLACVNSLKK